MSAAINSTTKFTRLALQLNLTPEFFYTVADNLEHINRQFVPRYFKTVAPQQVSLESYSEFRDKCIKALLDPGDEQ